ncbi:MAG: HD domain-containing protein [Candidatus Micrarchaeia archaeon]
MEFTSIRDPVHGQIMLDSLETRLMDTPDFQRLRGIKQLGVTYLVYPGAHHTRFEHSIGTAHLAGLMGKQIGLEADELVMLRIAALLHDIGHCAFSHDSENVLLSIIGSHEKLGIGRIRSSPIKDIICENYTAKKISDIAFGESFGQLITSDIGADRLDYLLRDAHYTGVAYGVIDWSRIVARLCWHSNAPAIEIGGLEAAESVMLARFSMFHTVYYHHAVRIARSMFIQALKSALSQKDFDAELITNEGDFALLSRLWKTPSSASITGAFANRQLYKRALVASWPSLSQSAKKYVIDGKFASDLQDEFSDSALVDLPVDFQTCAKISILSADGTRKPLSIQSSISASLEKAANERATLIVCAPKDKLKKVGEFASKRLGVQNKNGV